MICKNCKEEDIDGNFCKHCGQKSPIKIDSKYFLSEIYNSVLQLDRGIFFTIKELFIRPGHSLREYIEGKRKNHYKPLAFVLLVSAVYMLISSFVDFNPAMQSVPITEGKTDSSTYDKVLSTIAKNKGYFTFLFLPFFSLSSYLAFKKSKYNYFEHLLFNTYIAGQQTIITLVLSLIFFKSYYLSSVPDIVSILFNFWAFSQFFNENKTIKNILLTILTYIIFILQFFLVLQMEKILE